MSRDQARAGRYILQPSGYRAFVPAALPPQPPIEYDGALAAELAAAADALGRLDGATQTLPNPDLFVAMYVRREAVLSSEIEGTQSSIDDVLAYELDPGERGLPGDVEEVVNHVRATNHGLERLSSLPLSLRLLREIHAVLLTTGRGSRKEPGEFRRTQNWIGSSGATLRDAAFVPPPPHEMRSALGDLELFMHADHGLPPLIECGVVHAAFETIHPFLDGNGRVGRLLITFLLVHRGVLHLPVLCLSHYLKQHRGEYYDWLTAVREDDDWEGWLGFFLRGVSVTSSEATQTARRIVALHEQQRDRLVREGLPHSALRALDLLYVRPLVDANLVRDELGVTHPTARSILARLEALGIIEEVTGGRRNRVFRHSPYLRLFEDEPALRSSA